MATAVVISSETRRYGQVKMFDRRLDKLFGFAKVHGSTLEVFFHQNTRLSYANDEDYPEKGNWISFEIMSGRKGMKAVAWQLEPDYIPPAIWNGARQHFDVSQIPFIRAGGITVEDLLVDSIDAKGSSDACVRWYEIVFRPSTCELFKIACWDSAYSSFQLSMLGIAGKDIEDLSFGNESLIRTSNIRRV